MVSGTYTSNIHGMCESLYRPDIPQRNSLKVGHVGVQHDPVLGRRCNVYLVDGTENQGGTGTSFACCLEWICGKGFVSSRAFVPLLSCDAINRPDKGW